MFGFAFGGGGGNGQQNGGGGFPFFGGQPLGANQRPRTFHRSLRAFPYIMHPSGSQTHNEDGDKIFLPATALEELVRQNIQYPMLFQLQNQATQRSTHCGVLEFSAEEGKMYMPYWMMNNLLLTPGDIITVQSVSLPKASYTKLQPQENAFLKISNPKAVLEHELRKFSCLTKGDQITITYDNTKYNIEVRDLKPANACSIIETDCQVDFETPPNWAEEEAKWKKKPVPETSSSSSTSSSTTSSSTSSTSGTSSTNPRAKSSDSSATDENGKATGKRKADGTPGKERIGTLDLAKLAAERAERRAQLTSPQVKAFSGSGRRVDGRPQKNSPKMSADAPPPAPQAPPLTISAPQPGAATNRSGLLKKFRKRKEGGAFGGNGNSLSK
jgi:ubiquitin fusion degradation protein 1